MTKLFRETSRVNMGKDIRMRQNRNTLLFAEFLALLAGVMVLINGCQTPDKPSAPFIFPEKHLVKNPYETSKNESVIKRIISVSVGVLGKKASGSGFLYQKNGDLYILTANHVLVNSANDDGKYVIIRQYFNENNVPSMLLYNAEIVKTNDKDDIGLLKVVCELGLGDMNKSPIKHFTPIDKPLFCKTGLVDYPSSVGLNIYHCSHPTINSLGNSTFSSGVISSVYMAEDGRIYESMNCLTLPGSSGGGIFTTDGTFIGMALRSFFVERKTINENISVRDFSLGLTVAISSNELIFWLVDNNLPVPELVDQLK